MRIAAVLLVMCATRPIDAQWRVRQTLDELTDRVSVSVTRSADRPVVTRSGSRLPTIAIRCGSGTSVDVLVSYAVVLESDNDDWVPVRWRIDSGQVEEESWSLAKSRTTVFATAPNTLAEALSKGTLFRVEAPEWPTSTSLVARFSLSGLTALLPKLPCWSP